MARQTLQTLLLLALLLTTTACGSGDDDGQRVGELIVGTWYRGWEPGDVTIEGDADVEPSSFSYDQFIFHNDGSYNGMIRSGTFTSLDFLGEVIYEGEYRCDNDNLKLVFTDEEGVRRTLLCQILTFNDDLLLIRFDNESPTFTVTLKLTKTDYSSSSSTSERPKRRV